MNKKVSVIIPAFNAFSYLSSSLDSIINQTYNNLEIIVIDDASTDNTKSIIKKYASKDSRIRPIYSEINHGVSRSRNLGLKIFTGDFVLFVDADDFLTKDAIEKMVEASIKYNSDFVDSYHLLIYSKNKKNYYFTEKKIPKEVKVLSNLKNNIEVLDSYTYITGKLISKELIKNIFFDEKLRRYEDLVFENELKLKLKNMILLNEVLYYYVQVDNSLINTLGEKHYFYIDAAKEVINIYKNSSKEIKLKIESVLFTNAFFTGISKIVKNNNGLDYNTDLLYRYFNEFDNVFKTYNENKYINRFLRKYYNKIKNNKKKIRKLIKRTRKINFIKLYFTYLSKINKYKK